MPDYFEMLEDGITEEVEALLKGISDVEQSKLSDVQPPTSVITAAARAAAQVFVAFDRGYRMNGDKNDGR
jgi:hypothetical protein